MASPDYFKLIHNLLDPIAPKGLSSVTFTRGGQGVEKAIITAMAERGQANWTAVGFQGSIHGNHTSLALAPFRGDTLGGNRWPALSYPTKENESQVLDSVRSTLKSQNQNGTPAAAVVIETVHSTSGNSASSNFLSELRSLTNESEAALIVDAQETGAGASGKNFWGFDGEADYLVFGKRTQIEGFYSRPESKNATISFGGDHLRLLQFQVIRDVIQNEKLIDRVDKTGAYLRRRLESSKISGISGVRGEGTNLFIDTQDENTAYQLHSHLLKQGVLTKLNGTRGISIKPSLLLEERHADEFVNALSRF